MGDARVDLSALTKVKAKLAMLKAIDPREMLEDWGKVIVEDNRAGILAGQDRDGNALKPVTYRGFRTAKKARFRGAGSGKFGTTKFDLKGFNYATSLPNNNLTTAQYQKLKGPPTAPRGEESRVIANLVLREPIKLGDGRWSVEAHWADVVDPKGRPFLHYLFRTRPLDGVRPKGRQKARQVARDWIRYWWKSR